MKRWMVITLYAVLLAAVLGMLGYELVVNENYSTDFLIKAGVCILGVVMGLLKVSIKEVRAPSNRVALYRKAYAEFIEGAFSDDKKLEKQFMDALEAYNQKKFAAALDKLNKLVPKCQRSTDRYAVTVFQGLCCHDMQLYKDAAAYYETALLTRPNSTLASNLGICHEKLGDYNAASDAYRQAAQLDPKNAVPYSNMAQIWMRLGDYQTAIEFAELAYQRNQRLLPALHVLAAGHHMLGHEEEYQKYARVAVASGSDMKNIRAYIQRLESVNGT